MSYNNDAAENGIEKIQKYASLYGLNETTGIEIEESKPQVADSFPVMAAIGQSNNNYSTISSPDMLLPLQTVVPYKLHTFKQSNGF